MYKCSFDHENVSVYEMVNGIVRNIGSKVLLES